MKFQETQSLRHPTPNPGQQGTTAPKNHLLFSIPRLPDTDHLPTDSETSPERQRRVAISTTERETATQPFPTPRWSVRRNAQQARTELRRRNILLMLSCVGAIAAIFLVLESRRAAPVPKVTAKHQKRAKPAPQATQHPEVLRLPEEESGPVFPNAPAPNDGSTAQTTLPAAQPIFPVAGDTLLQPYQRRVKWAHHSRDPAAPAETMIQNVGGQSLISPSPNWGTSSGQFAPQQR